MLTIEDIQINALKHHIGYIRDFITTTLSSQLPGSLHRIGNSRMDIYYGVLSIVNIKEEILQELMRKNISTTQRYLEMIGEPGYTKIVLSDGSTWILRRGDGCGIVHIHPARYSVHTLRVTSNILKTAITYRVCINEGIVQANSPQSVDYARSRFLSLSPVGVMTGRASLVRIDALLAGCEHFLTTLNLQACCR